MYVCIYRVHLCAAYRRRRFSTWSPHAVGWPTTLFLTPEVQASIIARVELSAHMYYIYAYIYYGLIIELFLTCVYKHGYTAVYAFTNTRTHAHKHTHIPRHTLCTLHRRILWGRILWGQLGHVPSNSWRTPMLLSVITIFSPTFLFAPFYASVYI